MSHYASRNRAIASPLPRSNCIVSLAMENRLLFTNPGVALWYGVPAHRRHPPPGVGFEPHACQPSKFPLENGHYLATSLPNPNSKPRGQKTVCNRAKAGECEQNMGPTNPHTQPPLATHTAARPALRTPPPATVAAGGAPPPAPHLAQRPTAGDGGTGGRSSPPPPRRRPRSGRSPHVCRPWCTGGGQASM